ncbi:MAG TPA: putative glycoside hydrolase, partial [Longimicrobium sp.]
MMHILFRLPRALPLALLGVLACGDAGAKTEAAAPAKGTAAAATPADTGRQAAAPGDDRSTVGNEAIRAKAPAVIRGLYINAYAAGSRTRLPKLLAMADQTEINAFVIDVKDELGIRYQTSLELPKQLAQPGEVA